MSRELIYGEVMVAELISRELMSEGAEVLFVGRNVSLGSRRKKWVVMLKFMRVVFLYQRILEQSYVILKMFFFKYSQF